MGRAEDNTPAHSLMRAVMRPLLLWSAARGRAQADMAMDWRSGWRFQEQSCYCDTTLLFKVRRQETSAKLAALYGARFLSEDMEITAEAEAEERRWVTPWAGLNVQPGSHWANSDSGDINNKTRHYVLRTHSLVNPQRPELSDNTHEFTLKHVGLCRCSTDAGL